MLSYNERDKKKLLLANNTQQCRLSEEYINTYVLHVIDALLRIQDKYIYLSLNGQQSKAIVSANQETTRGLSQERKHYGIQLSKNTSVPFFSVSLFKKFLSTSIALNI